MKITTIRPFPVWIGHRTSSSSRLRPTTVSLAGAKAGSPAASASASFPTPPTTGVFEPREHIATTARAVAQAREALGDRIALGIDWHHRLSVAEAANFCQRMPTGTLDFLEEPIRYKTPEALWTLTDVPFAIGEEFSSRWQFLPFIERGIHQFNRIDVCNVGGLTEAMKVAGWSEAHDVDLMPHNPLGPICTAAAVHLAAAIPNYSCSRHASARTTSTPAA